MNFEDLSPLDSDSKLQIGAVFIENVEPMTAEISLTSIGDSLKKEGILVTGFLPTPCNQLRMTVSSPDANGNIQISAYSLIDPQTACIQVLQPFATVLPLDDIPAGEYTVIVNEEQSFTITVSEQ